jgi:thiamine biosynthesis lipoprotein
MMKKCEFRAMGSRIEVIIDPAGGRAAALLGQVPAWFEEWEQSLSRFREESELSRLNHGHLQPIRVSQTMWDVLQLAIRSERESDGLVTPLVLNAMETIGYDRSFDIQNKSTATANRLRAQPVCSLEKIILDPSLRSVLLPEGTRLDLGGTAKGWAAHQAMRRLSSYGPALVNAGGDIAISQLMQGGNFWEVNIIDPVQPESHLAVLRVGRGGVATSGRDYRNWSQGGLRRHHIIDPKTGLPAETDILSATIVAATVMGAEMAAKTVLILGSRKGLSWLEKQTGLAGFLVLENGKTQQTKKMTRYLWRN